VSIIRRKKTVFMRLFVLVILYGKQGGMKTSFHPAYQTVVRTEVQSVA